MLSGLMATTQKPKKLAKRYDKVQNPYTGKVEQVEIQGKKISKQELDSVFAAWDQENAPAKLQGGFLDRLRGQLPGLALPPAPDRQPNQAMPPAAPGFDNKYSKAAQAQANIAALAKQSPGTVQDLLDENEQITGPIRKVTSSLNIPIPFTDRYLPTGDIVGAIASTPFEINTELGVLTHKDSTTEQKARAGTNLILNAGGDGVVIGALGKYVAKPIIKKVRDLLSKGKKAEAEKVMAQALKETPEAGATPIEDAIPGFKPKKEAPARPVAKTEDATGLANQVQTREVEAGILKEIPATKGKGPEELQRLGKEKFGDNYDFEGLADRIAKGEELPSAEKFGILLEGKVRLRNEVNRIANALKERPGDPEALQMYEAAKERLQTFAENVQRGKGEWSDMGRALQAGTDLDTGDFAQVLEEAQRHGTVDPKLEKQYQKQTEEVTRLREREAELEAELAKARAEGTVTKAASRKATRENIAQEREAIFKEIDDIFKEVSGAGLHDIGSATYTAVKAGSKLAAAGGKLALSYAKEGITLIDEIAERVIRDFQAKGLEIDRQTIIDEMARPQGTRKTKNEIEKAIGSLKAQVKRESTENRAKIQGEIDSLKKQLETGDYRVPNKRELIISKDLEKLQAEKSLLSNKVKTSINRLGQPKPGAAVQAAKEVSGLGKIITLGSDFGALLRQGLFGVTNPKAYGKALASVKQGIKSEADLFKLETNSLAKEYPDGVLAEKIRKKSGLSRSSMGDPEEGYLIGVLDKLLGGTVGKIPGLKNVGGALGRGQSAFLNTLRNEMFDDFYIRHPDASAKELEDWAKYLNSAFGRSASYGAKKTPGEAAQILLTSPRYEASRWEMVGNYLTSPATAAKAFTDKAARAKILNLAGTGATVFTTLKIAEATTGGKLELDPDSSDFLKLRIGDKVIDLTAGISPRLRGVIRTYFYIKDPEALTQYTKASGEPYKRNETLPKEILKTVTRPVSPFVSSGIEWRTGYSLQGYREDEGDAQGWERLMPLIAQGFKQDFEKEGIAGAAKNAAIEFVGGSVQRYPAKPKQ